MPIVEPSEPATVVVGEEVATRIADGEAAESGRLLGRRSAPPWARAGRDPALFQAAAPSGPYPAQPPAQGYEPEVDSEVDIMGDPAGTGGGRQPEYEGDLPTGVDRAPPGYDAEPISELYDPGKSRRRGLIGGALIALFVIVGLVGWQAGLFGGGREDEANTEGVAAKAPEPETITAPPVEPDPSEAAAGAAEAPAKPDANATGVTLEEALAVEEPERAPGPVRAEPDPEEAEAAEAQPSKKQKAKVSVEFTASNFYFVYVKVAGRSLTLEPKKTVRLPVGSHAVYFRQKADQSWKKAGTIRLSRGSSYKVAMKKPGSLQLTKK